MHEEDRGSARTRPRRCINNMKAILLQVIERFLNIRDAQRDVRKAAAPAILLDLLAHRRFRRKRLQQLNEVGAFADAQQDFANQVLAVHVFAVNLREAHEFIRGHLFFQVALLHGNRHMVKEKKSRNLLQRCRIYSHSNTTCPLLTLSPAFTFTVATLPACGAVISVSIFMASRTKRMSPGRMAWPARTFDFTTMPETGLRHTFSSFTTPSPLPPPVVPAGAAAMIVAGACIVNVGNTGGGSGATSTSTSYVFPSTVTLSFIFHPDANDSLEQWCVKPASKRALARTMRLNW